MKTKLTSAQVKARLAAHKPSWNARLSVRMNRLSFPSLTQGADKLTEGKRLAGELSIMRHYDKKVSIPPDMAARFERAIVERDSKFQSDYRNTKTQSGLRPVYSWMLRSRTIDQINTCESKAQIWRLLQVEFPKPPIDRSNFYRLLRELCLPMSKPCKKRSL